jgi:hypothetical protein
MSSSYTKVAAGRRRGWTGDPAAIPAVLSAAAQIGDHADGGWIACPRLHSASRVIVAAHITTLSYGSPSVTIRRRIGVFPCFQANISVSPADRHRGS